MERELTVRIRVAGRDLMHQVEQIASAPGNDVKQLQQQVALLANAINEVNTYCTDVHQAIETLLKNAQFQPQKP